MMFISLPRFQRRDAAGKQCKISSSLFVLTADDKEISSINENMESLNYFNVKHGLVMIGN